MHFCLSVAKLKVAILQPNHDIDQDRIATLIEWFYNQLRFMTIGDFQGHYFQASSLFSEVNAGFKKTFNFYIDDQVDFFKK